MSPVRILIILRNRFESYRQTLPSKTQIVPEEIFEDDTKLDISLFLEANMDCLPSVNEEDRQRTVARILEKSAGYFLWVNLVLKKLKQVHIAAEIAQVLKDIPSDMNDLYSRILSHISAAPYGKSLAKAILTWIVCSARPLITEELYRVL